MLKNRVDQPDEPETALNVFWTHVACNKHNDHMVSQECDVLIDIAATDLQKDASGQLRKLL